jgi:hypothetical protein
VNKRQAGQDEFGWRRLYTTGKLNFPFKDN